MAQANYPDAFIRYLRQEVEILRPIIETSLCRKGGVDANGAETIAKALLAITSYFAREIGSLSAPERNFWAAVVDFFSNELAVDNIAVSRRAQYFRQVQRSSAASASELLAPDLQFIADLQMEDRTTGTAFGERTRMLFWRFAAALIASDDDVDAHGEGALSEFRQILDRCAMSPATVVGPDWSPLLEQLKHTIEDLSAPVDAMMRMHWPEGEEMPAGEFLLATSLKRIAIHFLLVIGDPDEEEVRFYREFALCFALEDPAARTADIRYWRELLQAYIRQDDAVFRELSFPIIDTLLIYDRAYATDYAEECRAMYFRFANAFVKANDSVSTKEKAALFDIKRALEASAPAATPESQADGTITEQAGTPAHLVNQRPLEKLLEDLNSLIGLAPVKNEVTQLVNFLKVQELRASKNLPNAPISRHLVFLGNPGTGKTTVARLLAHIYQALGVLSKGHLLETDRSGLVAGYLGQTALKVQEVVKNAFGGVLFIDEAYALVEGHDDSFGQEALDTLLKLMEDHRDDLIVVVAGYTEKMNRFLSTNPGLRSRFNKYLTFQDYTPAEIVQIFESFCVKTGFILAPEAKEKLEGLSAELYADRDETFGNGRLARNLFETAINKQASRIVAEPHIDERVLSTLEMIDVPQITELSRAHAHILS